MNGFVMEPGGERGEAPWVSLFFFGGLARQEGGGGMENGRDEETK